MWSSARLLRSPIRHLSGPYQLTPSPRGSFSSLIERALPALLPGPDEVSHWKLSLQVQHGYWSRARSEIAFRA